MDAGSFISSLSSSRRRQPLAGVGPTVYIPSLRSSSSNPFSYRQSGDRFIPDRSAMDFDVARYLLAQPKGEEKENVLSVSPAKKAYRKLLSQTLMNDRTRIFEFNRKPPALSADAMLAAALSADSANGSDGRRRKIAGTKRYISQSSEKTLDCPELLEDFYLNLLDWGSRNVLSVALGSTVYLWNASNGSISELVAVDDDLGPVTSVSWAPDGQHIAIGLNNSHVQLWDSTSATLLRTLKEIHRSRVGSLSWNSGVLTTGGFDGKIVNNDVRISNHAVNTYKGHRHEVCGLKWCASGKQLASGGNDNLVHIWDLSTASSSSSSRNRNRWLHRFDAHNAAVKALAWCPFQSHLLASGGGDADRCIKFWDTVTGDCVKSIDAGSQISALLWSKNERELLSSHGFPENQLTLWKYTSMVKMAEPSGHSSRILHMTQSPDGCTVATMAADETLRFWSVFGKPKLEKTDSNKATYSEPFANYSRIR